MQKYPMVLGTDVAGEVHEVGQGVTHVKKGDRVLGYVSSLPNAHITITDHKSHHRQNSH